MDYFTLFGLPITLPVDGSLLVSSYQTLQRQYHPDRFVTASESERLQVIQKAATINDAYQTLKNPLSSAEYLLSLQGVDVLNEQQSMRDSAFLMQQLALREELDEIANQPTESALSAFTAQISNITSQYYQQMIEQINNQQWLLAGDIARKLRFLDRLKQQIEQIEERMEFY